VPFGVLTASTYRQIDDGDCDSRPSIRFQSPGQCNSILFGVADNLLQRLQSVENAVVRVITSTGRYEHITPVLHQRHWLPVREQKLAVFVYMISFQDQLSFSWFQGRLNEYQLLLGRQRQVRFIPLADERGVCR